jgi:Nucleotidyltransferase domain
MSTDYLLGILAREAVDTSSVSPVRGAQALILPTIRNWAGSQLLDVTPSGSFAKGTANRSGTDIDLFISLSWTTRVALKDIYNSLFQTLANAALNPRKRNVSISLRLGAFDVDLVPGRRQNSTSPDHSLYRNRSDSWIQTNVGTHILTVLQSARQPQIRILKLWRDQKGLDFPSFYLELLVVEALLGVRVHDLAASVAQVLVYFRDRILTSRVVDPANTNNIVSDEVTAAGKQTIRAAAIAALNTNWGNVVR